jgi:uncharacterized protein (TIGR01319 family)
MSAPTDEVSAGRQTVWTQRFVAPLPRTAAILLVDFGSTYTKVTAVEAESGRLLGTAQHATTIETDVLQGYEAARDALRAVLNSATFSTVLGCSSAGGGLRLAVIGLEPELTAEAARRAALNAGARIVTVITRGLTNGSLAHLVEARPDIVLLAGGTNGGNGSVLIESARALADSRLEIPIILAGNEEAQPAAYELLRKGGKHAVTAPNLMPEIGVVDEGPVRDVIRNLFVHHVIGGKHLSSRPDFGAMILMPTPDAVLAATELLAGGVGTQAGLGDLIVIDIGGATTDVHSVVRAEPPGGYARDLVNPPVGRTVEADLGLRWNAPGILEAAAAELPRRQLAHRREAAEARAAHPTYVAESPAEIEADLELASCAIDIALHRHAGRLSIELSPQGAALRKSGRDLRAVSTVVLSGGIVRHAPAEALPQLLPVNEGDDRILLPRHPRFVADRAYLLAAAGLLATRDRQAAFALISQGLMDMSDAPERVQWSASN